MPAAVTPAATSGWKLNALKSIYSLLSAFPYKKTPETFPGPTIFRFFSGNDFNNFCTLTGLRESCQVRSRFCSIPLSDDPAFFAPVLALCCRSPLDYRIEDGERCKRQNKPEADEGDGQFRLDPRGHGQGPGSDHGRHSGFEDRNIDRQPLHAGQTRQTSRAVNGARRSLTPRPNPRGAITVGRRRQFI